MVVWHGDKLGAFELVAVGVVWHADVVAGCFFLSLAPLCGARLPAVWPGREVVAAKPVRLHPAGVSHVFVCLSLDAPYPTECC